MYVGRVCLCIVKFTKIKYLLSRRPCDYDERGAHSEKNARCGHSRKKKRSAKPKVT